MSPRLLLLYVVLASLVLADSPASAGIVNVQSLLAKEADKGVSGAVTGSADWRTGNVDLLLLSGSALTRYKRKKHLVFGMVTGAFGESADTRIIARTFEHARYRYRFHAKALAEVFVQHEFDEFKRLKLRALVGIGPKFDVVTRKNFGLSLGIAYMLEHESLNDDAQPDAGTATTAHRNSSYLTGHYEVDERVQLIETFYIQPRLTDLNDTRLLSESQLVTKITKAISFTTSLSFAFDARTPDGVAETNSALKSSITVSF